LRSGTTRGRKAGRIERKANIGRATASVRSRGEKVSGFGADSMTIMSEGSKRSKLSADDVKRVGNMSVESALERAGEMLAVTEVKTEVIKRLGAVGGEGSSDDGWKRRQEQVVLEKRSDGLVADLSQFGRTVETVVLTAL